MAPANSREGFFQDRVRRRRLFYRLWEPPNSTALVVIVHGFGEHSGRYLPLAQALAEQGLAVVCPDLWGHGHSNGLRGDIGSFEQYLEDLDALVRSMQKTVAVFGHSFGALVAIHWALRQPGRFPCLILQSPLLGVGFTVPAWKERLAGFVGRFWQSLQFPIGLDPAYLSHDQAVVQRYQEDPLVHSRISLRCYRMLQQAMRQALERAREIAAPTLLLYGTADRIISLKACRDVFERLACEKRMVEFPDCYHELHHEASFSSVVEEILNWVRTHV